MISTGRLSKSSLRVNKTKWCSRASVCEKHFTNHWMGPKRSGTPKMGPKPSGDQKWVPRFSPPRNIKIKVVGNQIKTKNSFLWDLYMQSLHCKLQEISQKEGKWEKIGLIFSPGDYFGDNSSREQRRRSKFSGVRAFGKLLTEWLQLNNTAINPWAAPQGFV